MFKLDSHSTLNLISTTSTKTNLNVGHLNLGISKKTNLNKIQITQNILLNYKGPFTSRIKDYTHRPKNANSIRNCQKFKV